MPSQRGLDLLRGLARTALPGPAAPLRARQREAALALLRAENLAEPGYSYRILALDAPVGETLRLAGETLHAPRLLPATGQLTALACAVCSVGPKLEARVSSLFMQKRASLALALDALGNELLLAVSRRLQDKLLAEVRRRRLTLSGELRPGDPGLALEAQAAVLRLAQAEAIEVGLRGAHTLVPLKSMSMVMGVGVDLPSASWSRCDLCPSRAGCKLVARAEVAP